MKAVVILGDGMSDRPVAALNGRTPLMAARKPAMDNIARLGRTGRLVTVESDMPPGSEVANLTVLGYDPRITHQGRGVLEAASLGIGLKEGDLALRVNLIHVSEEQIKSHSAGHITGEEAALLLSDLRIPLESLGLYLYQGLSYRHVLVMPGGDSRIGCAPPHDHLNEPLKDLMVKPLVSEAKETAGSLNRMIILSQELLSDHPVNLKREAEGKPSANSLWPWSPGYKPEMVTFQKRFGVSAATISAVDLIKGIAHYAGMEVIAVRGATGLYDTNYEGKADACLQALFRHDFVFVHVEAPDEAGHEKDMDLKIRCIEELDRRLVQRIIDGVASRKDDTVIAVLPDHATPVECGCHVRDAVPVAVWDPLKEPDTVDRFDEESVKQGVLGLMKGDRFIRTVLRR